VSEFDRGCALVESALATTLRQDLVADLARSPTLGRALSRLRDRMQAHAWGSGAHAVDLDAVVQHYDRKTRQDGFHVLHDWDGKAEHVNENAIAVDVLNFMAEQRGAAPADGQALAILIDYYFMYILALFAMNAWDAGSPDKNLERVTGLLADLQGPHGSGQRFADDAETLMLIATAHYEPDDKAYDRLLERARTLNRRHRMLVALGHAASLGSHLRFGFEATYGKDISLMRADNVVDYHWLRFALATLMRDYARMSAEGVQGVERDKAVEALLNGLTSDADAFVGSHPPDFLVAATDEWNEFRDLFERHRRELEADFECERPSDRAYSPVSLLFNFSHNVVKGTIVDALLWGEAWTVGLNDLLTGIPHGEPRAQAKERLARTLMGYARAHPDTIRGRLMPVIVYDPPTGRRAYAVTLGAIRGGG
jgi:hypothetical protein